VVERVFRKGRMKRRIMMKRFKFGRIDHDMTLDVDPCVISQKRRRVVIRGIVRIVANRYVE